jgi:molecular chaperone DnaK
LGCQLVPEEILSHILHKLADDAKAYLKRDVNQVVISVPSCWNSVQYFAVQKAAELAGLEVLRILSSTSSSAFPYGFPENEGKVVLVFDIDFNCFNVSRIFTEDGVYEVNNIYSVTHFNGQNIERIITEDGVYEVNNIYSDTHFNGQNFEQIIVNWFIEELKRIQGIYLRCDSNIIKKLNQEAENAIINLSSVEQVEINLSKIINLASLKPIKITLTRHKFNELCADLIKRCRAIIEKVISLPEIEYYRNYITVVVLGGSTQIPIMQNLIKQILGKNSIQSFRSDIAAVLGVGIQAGILSGVVEDVLLLDVLPLSLGVQAEGGLMVQIIPGNTTFPTECSQTFSTLSNNQAGIGIHILEGEHRLAKFNKSLGIIYFEIPPTSQNTPEIEIIFSVDVNRNLTVTALDKKSGIKQDMQIDRATILPKIEVDNICRRYGEGLLELRLKK